nr:putative ORF1 [Marmot picobirnavirus]
MTRNQIAYWEYVETGRHNLATEKETNRHNLATEQEIYRHNVATEGETYRHNVATEQYNLSVLQEQKVVNHRNFMLALAQQNELIRSHKAQEKLSRLAQLETARHNLASENVAVYQLQLQSRETAIKHMQATESVRHNMATEQLQSISIAETSRANKAREANTVTQLLETNRSNLMQETIQRARVEVSRQSLLETARHNVVSETELTRHNRAEEEIRMVTAGLSTLNSVISAAGKTKRVANY